MNKLKGHDRIAHLWHQLLIEIGENPSREGLIDTPNRVSKMYKEVFRGYGEEPPSIKVFCEEGSTGLIIDSGYFFSHCEHHCIPFFGDYYYGYIPKNSVIVGASKIGRTIDHFSSKLQIAERLCRDVIYYLETQIHPLGSILLMSGRHLCKEMRGVKKHNSTFEVIKANGILLENKDGCKDEFLSRIGRKI